MSRSRRPTLYLRDDEEVHEAVLVRLGAALLTVSCAGRFVEEQILELSFPLPGQVLANQER